VKRCRMINRRRVLALCFGAIAAPFTSLAQQAEGKVPRVGFLISETLDDQASRIEAAMGLVTSLARPGGNVTGATTFGPEIMAKRLELLKEVMPGVTRVAILVNPANSSFAPMFKQLEIAAKSLNLSLNPFEVRTRSDLERVLRRWRERAFTRWSFKKTRYSVRAMPALCGTGGTAADSRGGGRRVR